MMTIFIVAFLAFGLSFIFALGGVGGGGGPGSGSPLVRVAIVGC